MSVIHHSARRWLLAVCLSLQCVQALAADRFDSARQFIREQMVLGSQPSIAVTVTQGDRILWEEGFGWADRERRIPATEHTLYSLASVSKPMTTTAVMKLVEAGRVSLDQPINDYLGEAKLRARIGDVREATVRRLANHTSGLPTYAEFLFSNQPHPETSTDELILRYGELLTPPAEKYIYSNLGYTTLAYMVERVSGLSFADYMRREIFLPLGMTHSSVGIEPSLAASVAVSYGKDGRALPVIDFPHPGATGIYASAHDLARFGQFHLKLHRRDQQRILSDAAIDAMHRPTVDLPLSVNSQRRRAGLDRLGYGIGFFTSDRQGHRMVWHSGGQPGVNAQLQTFPDDGLVVVVLGNSADPLPSAIADRIVDILLPKRKSTGGTAPATAASVGTPQPFLGTWTGTLFTYAKPMPVQLTFLADGHVLAKLGGQREVVVEDRSFLNGVFEGAFAGRIETPDALRYEHEISLDLTLRGNELNGAACAGGVGSGARDALTHWISLTRAD
ncbi:serine hydrolase domain-containing protein [Steroidobacter sp.]|uniref:serine hydrolase domain-containing protein n=1 Tax=Steroidobacter sp. TaxID=1978227 RepID=UPI001A3F1E2C|nr:serine hydrolase domain-containing protein [Steroidobacter sp.]MBL8268160.1 beta-lactamase family protein [Steroidobacter sp.]